MEFLLSWFDGLTHMDDSQVKTHIQMGNSRNYGKIMMQEEEGFFPPNMLEECWLLINIYKPGTKPMT